MKFSLRCNSFRVLQVSILSMMMLAVQSASSQSMGISSTAITPDASSILEMRTTTKGLLIPRMTTTERDNINTPATGLIVYNTTTNKFNFYNGSSWTVLFSGSAGINSITGTSNRITIGGTAADPTIDISSSYVGQSSITTLGTIGTGTWNGSIITSGYGGTGNGFTKFSGATTTEKTYTLPDASTTILTKNYTGALTTGILKNTTSTGELSIAVSGDFPTLNQNTTGSAATLTTSRTIYGNAFNGSADLNQIIASTYGGTGNGFTKFSGATSSEKTYTLPDASTTILTKNYTGALATGIIKNTTSTGELTVAVAGDFPTLNQNTTGSALTLTTARNIYGNSFDGSADLTQVISPTYGGTGIDNAGRTLTINTNSGTLSFPGASTTMTFPTTSATLARTDAGNTFTGASTASAWVLTSPTITTGITPTTDDGAALGSAGNKFSDLFLASGGVINFNAGNVTLTHAAGSVTVNGGGIITAAGTSSLTPLKITNGALATTSVAGGVENDGISLYSSTTDGDRGVVPSEKFTSSTATFAFPNNANANPLFATTEDAFNVVAGTSYFFEGSFELTGMGTTTRTTATVFGGTATLTSIAYDATIQTGAANALSTTQSTKKCVTATSNVLNATATTAAEWVYIRGIVRINGGGTFIPQLQHSANPTGTILVSANSWFRMYPIGTNTVIKSGNIN